MIPSYLLKRNSTFYYRIRITYPIRCRIHTNEIRLSLRTGSPSEARRRASLIHGKVCHLFDQLSQGDPMSSISNEKLKQIVRDHVTNMFRFEPVVKDPYDQEHLLEVTQGLIAEAKDELVLDSHHTTKKRHTCDTQRKLGHQGLAGCNN